MTKNAPGKHYRKGISLLQILKMFPDNATAEQWFAKKRWANNPFCPHCGSFHVKSGTAHKTMPYRCNEKLCGKRFSLKTKTVMECSKLGYQVWAIAIYLMTTSIKGVSSMKLHRDLDITQKSAWFLAHRLRESGVCEDLGFIGPVEVDEAYFGGKEANKHNFKKLKAGRGGVGKAIVVGAKDRATNQVRAVKVERTDRETLQGFVCKNTSNDAIVYTDDHKSYTGLPYKHETVKHSVSQYVNGQAHTNGIESFWALLKRGYYGVYHHMSEKHLNRYIGEFSDRHNNRPMDTITQMESIVQGISRKRLKYQDLIA